MIKRIIKHMRDNRILLTEINDKLNYIQSQNSELTFAHYFQDSIRSSEWVKDQSFSAFAGAANYSLLYKLFRIYDIVQPQKVLEFGLGQTTKLSSQYALHNKKAEIIVVDDDKEWVNVYKQQILPKNLNLVTTGLQDFHYKGKVLQKMSEYANLDKVVGNKKFNLIIIDGPIGYGKEYPRTNIIKLTKNLDTRWIVIFDDAERVGEQNTVDLFVKELNASGKEYGDFSIVGSKTQRYFCDTTTLKMLFAI